MTSTRPKANARSAAACIALASLGAATRAEAQVFVPSCSALVAQHAGATDAGLPIAPVYIAGPADAQGSSGAQATAIALAAILGASLPIVYVGMPSCLALEDVIAGVAGAASANYVGSGKTLTPCTASGAVPDIAISDVYADTCSPGLLTRQADFLGPVSVATFVVPFASTEQSISADAAYVVFGFGGKQYAVKPWTDPSSIFAPTFTSGPLSLIGATIGLRPIQWANPLVSVTPLSSEVKAVSGGKTNAAIGILPAPTAQASPTALKALAYQHTDQSCGYLPDSDALHLDRINVRQGRYALWGPLHFVMNIDANGTPRDHTGQPNATLAEIARLLAATGPGAGGAVIPPVIAESDSPVSDDAKQTLVLAESIAGLVPWCAMQVARTEEAGEETAYTPPEPCGCAFESSVGAPVGARRCATCQTNADCAVGTPNCRYGYCEVQ